MFWFGFFFSQIASRAIIFVSETKTALFYQKCEQWHFTLNSSLNLHQKSETVPKTKCIASA